MDEWQKELIEKHLKLVLDANKTTNLTRIDTYEEGKLLHVEDSLSGLKEMKEAPEGLYGDMGTGGGFPGIPLAIATKRKTLLIDSVRKKTNLVQDMIEELGIDSYVSTYHGRLEDLAKEKRETFSVLTARALSRLSSLIELASPLLIMGGHLVCYKAHVSEEEFQEVRALEDKVGMALISCRNFVLSDKKTQRCIVTFEKTGEPKIHLPRKAGFAQKKPLH